MDPRITEAAGTLAAKISSCEIAELPDLLAEIARLQGRGMARLVAGDPGAETPAEGDHNLSVAEAARRLGMSRDWLYRNARKLPFALWIGNRLLFSSEGLARWNRSKQRRKGA